MSGWIDYFEDEITCPHCKQKLIALFIEDGNCKDPSIVTISLAGGSVKCPNCNIIIRDSDIADSSVCTNQLD